jgi:hypothetical protein
MLIFRRTLYGILTLCMLPYVVPIKSIQSVRIPDTVNIQCPPEDEHVMLET